uniref:Uncharacterized protein n=1 Tax=Arundo donax TaxID=35708 RepID=A0A0A9B7T8_ARUDO
MISQLLSRNYQHLWCTCQNFVPWNTDPVNVGSLMISSLVAQHFLRMPILFIFLHIHGILVPHEHWWQQPSRQQGWFSAP